MLLTILGLVFTVILGVVSIVLAVHKKKYPKRLKSYIIDRVRIWDPEVDKYKNTQITYANKKVSESVSYVKGLFCGDGSEDIVIQDPKSPFCTIVLPQNYRWLEVHSQEKSPNLEVTFAIDVNNPNILNLYGSIIKREECFCFDGFYEGKGKDERDGDLFKVSHRIPNTDISNFKILLTKNHTNKNLFLSSMISLSLIIIILMFYLFSPYQNTPMTFYETEGADRVTDSTRYCARMFAPDSVSVLYYDDIRIPLTKERLSTKVFKEKYSMSGYYDSQLTLFSYISVIVVLVICLAIFILVFVLFLKAAEEKYFVKRYQILKAPTKDE